MSNADSLVGNPENKNTKYCLAKLGEIYIVYLPEGGSTDIDLGSAASSFEVKWFDPRNGGALQEGSVKQLTGPGKKAVGFPPAEKGEDWVILIRIN
jgi:hypothetical protein